ncbi:M56 family metallopeptidase [Kitasatospora sp. NPDC101157]|uniref:M56 family metallopeptidase n=1 Tax=Kitasatospora sp. NPDC101157 TaxID=3364098 RepID=UPI00382E83FA
MTALIGLLLLGLLLSTVVPRALARARWVEREPVLALLVWQCIVVAVLLCCALGLVLAAAAAEPELRAWVFSGAPHGVEDAYGLQDAEGWGRLCAAALAAGALQTVLALTREVRTAKALRNRRHAQLATRAPELPAAIETARSRRERLVVLENVRPEAWSLPGPNSRLVVTTGALQQLTERELAAVLSHERGHVRARHHWLQQFAQALASGFPGIGVFRAFRDQVAELVELAADDRAARRHGRHTTALALAELNLDRGVFGSCPPGLAQSPKRVDRLLAGRPRLSVPQRLRLTAVALAAPVGAVLLAVAPGLHSLL